MTQRLEKKDDRDPLINYISMVFKKIRQEVSTVGYQNSQVKKKQNHLGD